MDARYQVMLWGLAVCVPLLLSLGTRKTDALGLSAVLLLTWCFGRVTSALYSPPESMALYPLVDAMCAITAFAAWRTRPAPWKFILGSLFVLQCALHFAFWIAWPMSGSLYRYVVANNILFALELVIVSVPGGRDVVARAAGGRVFGGRGLRAHPRIGSWD